jgi:hypothetical protein
MQRVSETRTVSVAQFTCEEIKFEDGVQEFKQSLVEDAQRVNVAIRVLHLATALLVELLEEEAHRSHQLLPLGHAQRAGGFECRLELHLVGGLHDLAIPLLLVLFGLVNRVLGLGVGLGLGLGLGLESEIAPAPGRPPRRACRRPRLMGPNAARGWF